METRFDSLSRVGVPAASLPLDDTDFNIAPPEVIFTFVSIGIITGVISTSSDSLDSFEISVSRCLLVLSKVGFSCDDTFVGDGLFTIFNICSVSVRCPGFEGRIVSRDGPALRSTAVTDARCGGGGDVDGNELSVSTFLINSTEFTCIAVVG